MKQMLACARMRSGRRWNTELFHLNTFDTTWTLKEALHDYIRYHNVDCIKLWLGGLSPVAYRKQAAAAPA